MKDKRNQEQVVLDYLLDGGRISSFYGREVLGIMDIEQTGLMLFGIAMVAVLGVFSSKLS